MPTRWYRIIDGEKDGPFDPSHLKSLADSGELLPVDLVWRDGLEEWMPARKVKGLFADLPPEVPREFPLPILPPVPVRDVSRKDVQTVERTSKRLKMELLIGFAFLAIGLIGVFVKKADGSPNNFAAIFTVVTGGSILSIVATKIRIWWHHG